MTIEKQLRVNQSIRAPRVRLIGLKGEQLGILPTEEALSMARQSGLDLVEVSSQADPPVCKILDYGKYKFDQKKRLQDAQKHHKKTQLKEIKLRPKISEHDYQFKLKHVQEFLAKGDKVKVTLQFRGRELAHKDLGYNLMQKFVEDLSDTIVLEKQPVLEGRQIIMILISKTHKS